MKAFFDWTVNNDGFLFICKTKKDFVEINEWAKYDLVNKKYTRIVRVGPILRMLEDEIALEAGDKKVLVPHLAIADLNPDELHQLALPEPAPFTLHIESKGLVSDPDFAFIYAFWRPDNTPLINPQRKGCLILVGTKEYILTEPYYSIIEALDRFKSASQKSIDERLVALSTIKEKLPKDVVLGDYLTSINVVTAHHFSIDPFVNEQGEPDFDPVLVRQINKSNGGINDEESLELERVLPKACEEFFSRHFRRKKKITLQYPAGNGWFVVLSEPLRTALQIVREYQLAEPEVRRRFITNPRPFLKEGLGQLYDESLVDNLFQESLEYGERVKKIGHWSPPVLPFIKKMGKEPWLPPEVLGIRVGDQWIVIDTQDIESLHQKVIEAKDKGEPNVNYKGNIVPATQQTLEALEQLIGIISPVEPSEKKKSKKPYEKYVLIIKGNFEEIEIQYKREQRPGKYGEIPCDLLKTKLLPHQEEGLKWLQEHWISDSPGAILADDMGLGKTLQALAFLAWVRKYNKGPFLVVAPTGLLDEWAQQSQTHLKESALGDLIKAYGRTLKELRKRKGQFIKEIETGVPALNTNELAEAGWVLATYETIRDYQHSFGQVKWKIIIFDEAQKIKNPSTMVSWSAKAMQSDFALALTGTPVENRPVDMWCIVDTVRPGELGSLKEFSSKYEKDNGLTIECLKKLNFHLTRGKKPSILMRRQKSDYLKGLPPKKEHILKETMPPPQSDAYDQVIAWAKKLGRRKGGMLEALHKLRSVSLHPLDMKAAELSDLEYIQASARLITTFKVLDEIANRNEKVLIFLESLAMQGYLAELIQKRYKLSLPPMIINGSISGPKRKKRVELFQKSSDFDVMILSPKAGGVGFTITAANHVIHLSRWWNPAVEDQCTDRVYRISQQKPVHVYYPIAIHPNWDKFSFDLKLHELLNNKRLLFKTILAPPSGTSKDAKQLFNETVLGNQSEINDREQLNNFFNGLDLMEPLQFEEWVLSKLRDFGYNVKRTPISGDRGADVIALAPKGSGWPNLIIQVKHTQRNSLCSDKAIDEILKAIKYYPQVPQPILQVVVTNASGFPSSAIEKAQQNKILLIDKEGLSLWPAQVVKKTK